MQTLIGTPDPDPDPSDDHSDYYWPSEQTISSFDQPHLFTRHLHCEVCGEEVESWLVYQRPLDSMEIIFGHRECCDRYAVRCYTRARLEHPEQLETIDITNSPVPDSDPIEPFPQHEPDFRDLLKRYIAHVGNEEGATFLRRMSDFLTNDELELLEAIDDEPFPLAPPPPPPWSQPGSDPLGDVQAAAKAMRSQNIPPLGDVRPEPFPLPSCYECGFMVHPEDGEQQGRAGWVHYDCLEDTSIETLVPAPSLAFLPQDNERESIVVLRVELPFYGKLVQEAQLAREVAKHVYHSLDSRARVHRLTAELPDGQADFEEVTYSRDQPLAD